MVERLRSKGDGASVPLVCIPWETRTLHTHDAEPLASRSLHHHPPLQANHDVRPQFLETRDLRRNIVRLDVQVDATFVIDALNLHNGFVWWGLQHPVVAAAAPMIVIHGTTECHCPEAGGLVYIRGITVDQEGAKT
jgi:hypothetical protein